jgi:hypothetical protein
MLALGHVQGMNDVQCNVYPHQCRTSLLQTCRLVLQEAFPIFHNQTRFDICFGQNDVFKNCSAYQLRLTFGRATPSNGLARVVLRRVKHVRVNFRNELGHLSYFWRTHLLSIFLGHGSWLKSLRFASNGIRRLNDGNLWYHHYDIVDFESYRGSAVIEIRNTKRTDEEIAEMNQDLERTFCSCFSYFHDKSLMSLQCRNANFPSACLGKTKFRVTGEISGPKSLIDYRTAG